jgi:hypothetical protein
MEALANSLELDHLVVNTWAHDPAVRRRSYALLAQAFGMGAHSTPASSLPLAEPACLTT